MIHIRKKTSKDKNKKYQRGHVHLIIGASRFGTRVALRYAKAGLYVTVVDMDKKSQYKLGDNFLGSFVLGDATKLSTLEEANVSRAKTILIVTDNEDTNIFIANLIYTKYHKNNIIVRLDDEDKYNLLINKDVKIVNPFMTSIIQFVNFEKEDEK